MGVPFPLYSVVVDNIEVATVGSDADAKLVCDGQDVVFIDKPIPSDVILRKRPLHPLEKKFISTKNLQM